MDSILSFVPAPWVLIICLMLLIIYVYGTSTYSTFKQMGVPYIKPVPIFGNVLSLFKEGFYADVDKVKKFGKVFGTFEFRKPQLVICDPELVREVCVKNFDCFANTITDGFIFNKELKKAMFVLKDQDWKGARSVISPTFSGRKMKRMTPMILECADSLVKHLNSYAEGKDNVFKANDIFGCYSMDVIASTAFGVKTNSQVEGESNDFVRHARNCFEGMSFANPVVVLAYMFPSCVDWLVKLGYGMFDRKSMKFFWDNSCRILDMRNKQDTKPTDLLQLMIDAHSVDVKDQEEPADSVMNYGYGEDEDTQKFWRVGKRALSREEIIANSIGFFVAGYETTASTLSWAIYELALHPEIQERLYDEVAALDCISYESVKKLQYLDQVFSETLRLWPIGQRIDRLCGRDCKVGGYSIRKGMSVTLSIWALHHDEDFWSEPFKFDPERFSPENKSTIVPYSYIPFGIGPRVCVGMRLAVLEAKIGLAKILQKFRFSCCSKTEVPPTLKITSSFGLTATENGIYVAVSRRE